ncbi:MAG TPA: adenylate/guanylate cyclase domain-containing protein [Verrucomicrobiae bacterium]|nr:adenylate/guanylate cyclase domain-containing protein [Verrucomicrobiae bacterium]
MPDSPAILASLSEGFVCKIIDWLSGDECHELDLSGLTAGLGVRMRAAGIPLDRMALHMRTLHPLIRGRTFAWAPNEPVEFLDLQHGADASALLGNPVHHVVNALEWLTLRLDDPSTKWPTPDAFRERNLTELLIAPLLHGGELASAVTFGTRQPKGFTQSQRALLQAVVPALRSASELKLLRHVETTLLTTYVGAIAGQHILAGHIRRGDVETLDAALMLCDLRGFTALSNQLPEERVLEILNIYFDQVVPAITNAGGEILKFMGDAVLAYFNHEDGAAASCVAAFDAAREALARLAAVSNTGSDLSVGVALHYGKVSYGNIGSGNRLDFTIIGRDVNLVSRIEGICASTGHSLVMSKRFASLLAASHFVSIGRHKLKGFAEPVELFSSTILDDQATLATSAPRAT